MENKQNDSAEKLKEEITDCAELDEATGGTGIFEDLPRVDDNSYTTAVTSRA